MSEVVMGDEAHEQPYLRHCFGIVFNTIPQNYDKVRGVK